MRNVDALIRSIHREVVPARPATLGGLIRAIESLTAEDDPAMLDENVDNKIPILLKQFVDKVTKEPLFTEEQIRSVAKEADPTPTGSYITWILKQVIAGRMRFAANGEFEDGFRIKEVLEEFHRLKAIPSIPIEKDINRYKSLGDLSKAIRPYTEKLSKRQAVTAARVNGMKIVYEKGQWQIFEITTAEAATEVAKGTEWCTKDPRWSQQYLDQGPLWTGYTFQCKCEKGHTFAGFPDRENFCTKSENGAVCKAPAVGPGAYKPFCQCHFPSNQFMDINDRPMRPDYRYAVIKVLAPFTGIDPTKDAKLAYDYAESKDARFPEGEAAILKDAATNLLVNYAEYFIRGRWPEAEPRILTEPNDILGYTQAVIKGRWPEGEAALLERGKDEAAARILVKYAAEVIGGRWPEAEPTILRFPNLIVNYAKTVIKGRWAEGEKALQASKDQTAISQYGKDVAKGAWP